MLSCPVIRITHPHISYFWRGLTLTAALSEHVLPTSLLGAPYYQAHPLFFSSHQLDHPPPRLPLLLQFYMAPEFGAQRVRKKECLPSVYSLYLLYLCYIYYRLRKARF